jgi:hypothetical protein
MAQPGGVARAVAGEVLCTLATARILVLVAKVAMAW